MLGFLLAALAAVSNAASNLLQREANRRAAPELALSPRLFAELLRQPIWLAGIVAVIVSFVLQVGALDAAALAAVQPVIIMELPLTLFGASLLLGAPMGAKEWLATALMTGGLVVLIVFLDPRPVARLDVPATTWALAAAATVAVIGALVLAGWRSTESKRAAWWGAACGVAFGLTAAFMKGMAHALHLGPAGVLRSWTTYAMVATGIGAMYLLQHTLHAGRLVAAQPGITLLDPLTAILWGALVFGEPTAAGASLLWAAVGAAVLATGAWVLVHAPALQEVKSAGSASSPSTTEGAGRRADTASLVGARRS
jgi:drug/metabolite transporter (DMT)-like permease